MGICFADPNGRIILCNNRMRRLSFALCGHELHIKSDMENTLSGPDRSVTVKDDCYILPDKTVWQFRTQNITVDSDDRWQQITAVSYTHLHIHHFTVHVQLNTPLKHKEELLSGMRIRNLARLTVGGKHMDAGFHHLLRIKSGNKFNLKSIH